MNCDHDYQATYCERCGGYTGEVCAQCGNWTDGGDYLASRADLWCDCHPDEDDKDMTDELIALLKRYADSYTRRLLVLLQDLANAPSCDERTH